jgi:hypothetical protein
LCWNWRKWPSSSVVLCYIRLLVLCQSTAGPAHCVIRLKPSRISQNPIDGCDVEFHSRNPAST